MAYLIQRGITGLKAKADGRQWRGKDAAEYLLSISVQKLKHLGKGLRFVFLFEWGGDVAKIEMVWVFQGVTC